MRSVLTAIVLFGITAAGAYAAPVLWDVTAGGNGHYYEAVAGTFTWDQASAASQAGGFGGHMGHLATFTSLGEWTFVKTNLLVPIRGELWLGGKKLPGSAAPTDNWTWVTGETWNFQAWRAPEPNNVGGNEDRLMSYFRGTAWNDAKGSFKTGYVVEYGDGPSTPELSTWALLACSGVLGLALGRRRRK